MTINGKVRIIPVEAHFIGVPGPKDSICWWAEVRDDRNRLIITEDDKPQQIRLMNTPAGFGDERNDYEKKLQQLWDEKGTIIGANYHLGGNLNRRNMAPLAQAI